MHPDVNLRNAGVYAEADHIQLAGCRTLHLRLHIFIYLRGELRNKPRIYHQKRTRHRGCFQYFYRGRKLGASAVTSRAGESGRGARHPRRYKKPADRRAFYFAFRLIVSK